MYSWPRPSQTWAGLYLARPLFHSAPCFSFLLRTRSSPHLSNRHTWFAWEIPNTRGLVPLIFISSHLHLISSHGQTYVYINRSGKPSIYTSPSTSPHPSPKALALLHQAVQLRGLISFPLSAFYHSSKPSPGPYRDCDRPLLEHFHQSPLVCSYFSPLPPLLSYIL